MCFLVQQYETRNGFFLLFAPSKLPRPQEVLYPASSCEPGKIAFLSSACCKAEQKKQSTMGVSQSFQSKSDGGTPQLFQAPRRTQEPTDATKCVYSYQSIFLTEDCKKRVSESSNLNCLMQQTRDISKQLKISNQFEQFQNCTVHWILHHKKLSPLVTNQQKINISSDLKSLQKNFALFKSPTFRRPLERTCVIYKRTVVVRTMFRSGWNDSLPRLHFAMTSSLSLAKKPTMSFLHLNE